MASKKLVIMVSSTVYRNKPLLEQIFTILKKLKKYEVWMSYKHEIPVDSFQSNIKNCLIAVEKCDLFLGIITPYYGSIINEDGFSSTHLELLKAIELNKPRWILVHDHVVFARSLLNDFRFKRKNEIFKGKEGRKNLSFYKKCEVLDDLHVIDMYEDAIRYQIPMNERTGNWVEEYRTDDDIIKYITFQLSRYDDVEKMVEKYRTEYCESTQEILNKEGHL
ncbi:DUF4062 domain-containing protein [Methanospirillum sp. J.3.6.1-F.2.7.3]|uniref:DUF4062 domain-containing protein n=1 Tax=Methanospirillum purgamenti TaxID=2834276 RepID=A0A8E7AX70_9EURY|nr:MULTISPECIES: DUF4062 domain-containing protein [Methanospirillum]MDX8549362.1 DUF4062 domain-containing protein [Methanospirillum hungatei]QVV89347.1 DUF4062 domain-containing protein [Methanospirillum sp. J.3.6.1-F.2.7.3]